MITNQIFKTRILMLEKFIKTQSIIKINNNKILQLKHQKSSNFILYIFLPKVVYHHLLHHLLHPNP